MKIEEFGPDLPAERCFQQPLPVVRLFALFLVLAPLGRPTTTVAARQQVAFSGSDYSVLPSAATRSSVQTPQSRQLVFNLYDDSHNLTIGNSAPVQNPNGYEIADLGGSSPVANSLFISGLQGSFFELTSVPCVSGGSEPDGASISVSVDAALIAQPPSTRMSDVMNATLASTWAMNLVKSGMTFSQQQQTMVTFGVQGGQASGQTFQLRAVLVTGQTSQGTSGGFFENEVALLVLDWGTDPFGNEQFVWIEMDVIAEVIALADDSCAPDAPTATQLSQQYLGTPDALTYANDMVDGFTKDLASGNAYLQGAIPELLYLYDFSGKYTGPVLNTVPADAITSADGVYPNFAEYVDQYDAGPGFNLPADSHGVIGGSACGPMALSILLNADDDANPGVLTIFNNSMSGGDFYYAQAVSWLQGNASFDNGNFRFPNQYALALPVFYAGATSANDASMLWAAIDNLLANNQPVLARTSLSCCPTPTHEGGGHDVLLLGRGQSDNVAQLYNTSGAYYIVTDPAGHYFADQASGQHYGSVDTLRRSYEGINYAGWFAMYPVELLQQHIHSTTDPASGPRLNAVTLGVPFYPAVEAQAQCPVAIVVTDPFGGQTGVLTNGTVLSGIPQAIYDLPWEDGEYTNQIDPNGPQTVIIPNPVAGTYQISLVGTNTGNFTLTFVQVSTAGSQLMSTNFSGMVSPGEVLTYSVTAMPTGPPLLHSASQGNLLTLEWPTNYTGFLLETTTDLANAGSWAPATNLVVQSSGLNIANVTVVNSRQFFRLMDHP